MDESGKICKVNVQHIKVTYPGDQWIKCLPDEKAFGCATRYQLHSHLMEDLNWSLNTKTLLYPRNNIVASTQMPSDQTNLTQNMSVPDTQTKNTSKCVGTNCTI